MEKSKKPRNFIIGAVVLAFYTVGVWLAAEKTYQTKLDQASELKNTIVENLSSTDDLAEYEKTMKENIKKLSKKDRTEVIDVYIYYASQKLMSELTTPELDEIFKTDANADGIIPSSAITDDNLRIKTENVEALHGEMRKYDTYAYPEMNFQYFMDTYKDDITPGYSDLLVLYKDEQTGDIVNPDDHTINIDTIENRMNYAYECMTKKEDADTEDMFRAAYNYYISVYLGGSNDEYTYDSDGVIKNEVLESYKTFDAKDPDLKDIITHIAEHLDESNGLRTTEIQEEINSFLGYGTTESESESASHAASTESINESDTSAAASTENVENTELETTWKEETTPEVITDTGVSVNETEAKK